jgi:ribosomal protein L14
MAKHRISSWKDCRDDRKVISFARNNNVEVREAKGDHFLMRKGDEIVGGVHREMYEDTAKKIFNFFRNLGLISVILLFIYRHFMA